ncbi:MAG: dinitrogenase iron-molybdenum cofactor biosynthesis protein [Anaerolineae bacterium]|nr:dinitrogenase iron-molybdenum cofactor biosynthesis protein [Anaerolineae bacterium]
MRIAFSSGGPEGLEATIHPHFGRCPWFTLVDVANGRASSVQTVANPYYARHEPGQVPAFIHQQGAQVMITGGMGGRAVDLFQQLGVEPITGASGTVRQALDQYLSGSLQGAGACREHEGPMGLG